MVKSLFVFVLLMVNPEGGGKIEVSPFLFDTHMECREYAEEVYGLLLYSEYVKFYDCIPAIPAKKV